MALFQRQCREAARRVGLVAFEAEAGVVFTPDDHALPEGESANKDAVITETRLPGYRLQGKLMRKPLVCLG